MDGTSVDIYSHFKNVGKTFWGSKIFGTSIQILNLPAFIINRFNADP